MNYSYQGYHFFSIQTQMIQIQTVNPFNFLPLEKKKDVVSSTS